MDFGEGIVPGTCSNYPQDKIHKYARNPGCLLRQNRGTLVPLRNLKDEFRKFEEQKSVPV